MTDLFAARSQMAVSLGFHILFAVAGMAMPLLMVLAEWRHRRTGEAVWRDLAQRWAKGTAILFAVGAVSGTVLSFELGLLWPTFMEHAGPLIGMPFSLEGFAFFLEAIFLGVYLYGWDRVGPRVHLLSGIAVAVSGLASGFFVVAVNAWMNTPAGFRLEPPGATLPGATVHDVDLWSAFFSPAFLHQTVHMAFAAYASVGFAVMGIHAWRLRGDGLSAFHRSALRIAFPVAVLSAPAMLVTGDVAAKHVAAHQPRKLAAAEAVFHTERGAPLILGGWPDEETGEVVGALRIPYGLSLLAHLDPDAEVLGLDAFPRDEWPPVAVTHVSFQLMVACGMAMLLVAAWGVLVRWRRGALWESRAWLRVAGWSLPLGLLAVEAGWFVTEVGRQPWIVNGVLRTADAVTPMPALPVPFAVVTLLYLFLGAVVLRLLRAHVFAVPPGAREPEVQR
jgi:cytochrome bd ubiquinol oxidase subunit I